ncbi:MAG TPA: hypothetical protein VKV05_08265 [Terriglobales bacterium]|nr:hypothetical protein [Terriglobales bacterium]
MTAATPGLDPIPNSTDVQRGSVTMAAELVHLPEFKNCVDELTKDQTIASHFDKHISICALGSYRGLTAVTALTQLIQCLLASSSGSYDSGHVEHVYRQFEDTFYCDTLECQAIAPIQGWFISDALLQGRNGAPLLQLSDEVEIRALTPHEREGVYQFELVRRHGPEWTDRTFAITVRYRLSKILMPFDGEDSLQQQRTAEQTILKANDRVDEVLQALRIFDEGSLRQGGVLHCINSPLFVQVRRIFAKPLADPLANSLSLYVIKDAQQLANLKEFWGSLRRAKGKDSRFLIVAMRRFSDADERHRIEDRVIDLMIAAEALSQASTTSEKGKKIAHHIASFSQSDYRTIKAHMLETYQLRNSIMHEGDASAWLIKTGRKSQDLRPFVCTAERYLRHALRTSIQQAAS